jgi:hypothetical protein
LAAAVRIMRTNGRMAETGEMVEKPLTAVRMATTKK